MSGTRLALGLVLGIGLAAPAAGLGDGGLFHRKGRVEPARVRQLAEIVRLDPDEKKRKAAVLELGEADPRVHPEVIPAVTGALRKDAAAAVRAAAAEVIGRFNAVFPTAGLALEDAAESDPAPAVRDAAKQALWEYHLIGYRSARGAGGFAGQTAEPPLAKPPGRPAAVTAEPPTAPVVAVGAAGLPAVAPLPPVGPPPGPPPGPRVSVSLRPTAELLAAAPPHPNLTVEPPVARPPARAVPLPALSPEPPIRPVWEEPAALAKRPRFALSLPPIVPPPGPLPGALPEPTAEPPIRKATASPGLPVPTISVPTLALPGGK